MTLSDKLIKEEIRKGNIVVENIEEELFNPASLDFRLDNRIKKYKRKYSQYFSKDFLPLGTVVPGGIIIQSDPSTYSYLVEEPIDTKNKETVEFEEFIIPEEGYVLLPNELYLGVLKGNFGVKGNIACQCIGKSSLGRLGLDIIIGPAGWADPGFVGSMVLELRCTVPIVIYPDMKICQVEYRYVQGEIEESYDQKKGSKYMNQTGIQESKYSENY